MNNIKKAKWIWENPNAAPDEHAEFICEFDYSENDGRVTLSISADSDYGFYLNGKLCDFGQYPDYPHYKVYDEFDVTDCLVLGKNRLAIEVWYYGNNCSTNIDDGAGLCFSLDSERRNLAISDERVLSRLSNTYRNHVCYSITGQLGYGYGYDANAEDAWISEDVDGFTPSVCVTPEKLLPTILRPIKNLVTEKAIRGKFIKSAQDGKYRYLFDFGKETVGVYRIKFNSPSVQNIELCYGEHIIDGWVRDRIHSRRFAFDYRAKSGENDYFGYFRRLGLRYAELRSDEPLENIEIDIFPRNYPLNVLPFDCADKDLKRIYDVCVETLKLCLHEHYEDCPWREQAMYVMDSRNQILCGYYAFGEFEFPRAAIKLMAEDRREDGMLNITYPGASGLVIPSFGLHFYTLVREYGDYSGDWAFVREIFPKLRSVLDAFFAQMDSNTKLLNAFGPACYWNFYEWAKGLDGVIGKVDEEIPDLVLNALFSLALQNMQYICDKLGMDTGRCYAMLADEVNTSINAKFFNSECSLYGMFDSDGGYSELGNALCVLCGAAEGEVAGAIADELTNPESELTGITLSMKCFKYDALLSIDEEKYLPYVLGDIKRIYLGMLDAGATSVWETEKGAADFGGAGSLCHGWSALPIYYIRKFIK